MRNAHHCSHDSQRDIEVPVEEAVGVEGDVVNVDLVAAVRAVEDAARISIRGTDRRLHLGQLRNGVVVVDQDLEGQVSSSVDVVCRSVSEGSHG